MQKILLVALIEFSLLTLLLTFRGPTPPLVMGGAFLLFNGAIGLRFLEHCLTHKLTV